MEDKVADSTPGTPPAPRPAPTSRSPASLKEHLHEVHPVPSAKPKDPWEGQPNEHLKFISSNKKKGEIGSALFRRLFGGTDVSSRSGRKPKGEKKAKEYLHDIDFDSMRIESKLACYSPSANHFHFAGMRSNYTHGWFVCVDFDTVRAFLVPKAKIRTYGAQDEQVVIPRNKTPDWLSGYEVVFDQAAGKWILPPRK